ncbi:MAG: EutN/CcmL family microcompartment protein [Opitutaceae bacterium]|nr:EutN/CcmL family microcompartment protein [Opitutaceae bacterium]
MRLGHVIGNVTLNIAEPALRGGRLLLVQPFGKPQFGGAAPTPLAKGATVVVYDELSAGLGEIIGFTEGAEATMPFTQPTPVDAYNAAIIDGIIYQPPAAAPAGRGSGQR